MTWAEMKFDGVELAKANLRRWWKAREVSAVVVRPGLASARVLVVVVVKDEAQRLPALLAHYRGLGVDHFMVVDNESSDGLGVILGDESDVSHFQASGSFRDSRHGCDWVNALLARYGRGRWVLWVDADEHLVFDRPGSDLPELCGWLESQGREVLGSIMVDMYSDGPARSNLVKIGQDPLEVCHLFDAVAYERRWDPAGQTTWVKGGVRGRFFFQGDVWSGPALNKTPLVKWRRGFAFIKVAHQLAPARLNRGGAAVQSALLHFKFTAHSARQMTDDAFRQQHTDEYRAYDGVHDVVVAGPDSRVYREPGDLVRAGLITSLAGGDHAVGPRMDQPGSGCGSAVEVSRRRTVLM